jgi:hypothetical protein
MHREHLTLSGKKQGRNRAGIALIWRDLVTSRTKMPRKAGLAGQSCQQFVVLLTGIELVTY